MRFTPSAFEIKRIIWSITFFQEIASTPTTEESIDEDTFGISAMIDNDRVLGIVLLSSSALFGLCKALLLHSKVLYNHVLAPFILVVSLAGLMLYLVITGGVANTGPLSPTLMLRESDVSAPCPSVSRKRLRP